VLTPEIKQLIANEVQSDLAAKKIAAQNAGGAEGGGSVSGLALLFNDRKPHVFVVSSAVSTTVDGQDCSLTGGDVLQSVEGPGANATAMNLTVVASKKKDCRQGSQVSVSLEDLQEMQNHLMATVDQGLDELSAHAGQGGLPVPPAGLQQSADAPYTTGAPAADANVDQELAQGEQEANQTEQAVLSQAAPGQNTRLPAPAGGSSAAGAVAPSTGGPVTIALGQSPAQVTAHKGVPTQVVNLGAKLIYVYPDMKIYFVGNKVSDVR
jgi:hypothetical protein